MPRTSTLEAQIEELRSAAEDGPLTSDLAAKAFRLYADQLDGANGIAKSRGSKGKRNDEEYEDDEDVDPAHSNAHEGEDEEDEDADAATTDMPKMKMGRGKKAHDNRPSGEGTGGGFGKSARPWEANDTDFELDPEHVTKSLLSQPDGEAAFDGVPFLKSVCESNETIIKALGHIYDQGQAQLQATQELSKGVRRLTTVLKSIEEAASEEPEEEPEAEVTDPVIKSMFEQAMEGLQALQSEQTELRKAISSHPVTGHPEVRNGNGRTRKGMPPPELPPMNAATLSKSFRAAARTEDLDADTAAKACLALRQAEVEGIDYEVAVRKSAGPKALKVLRAAMSGEEEEE
jgi:hypothetical protein